MITNKKIIIAGTRSSSDGKPMITTREVSRKKTSQKATIKVISSQKVTIKAISSPKVMIRETVRSSQTGIRMVIIVTAMEMIGARINLMIMGMEEESIKVTG